MKNYPLFKCTLSSDDNLFAEMDVTSCINDWEMMEVVLERDKTSGVSSEVSFTMEFVLKARDLLKALFQKYGLYARARINVWQRGDFDTTYTLSKSMPLEFGTYKEYNNMVTIEAAEADLLELINSEGKTKYEIPVAEVAEEKQWDYQRMELINTGSFAISSVKKDEMNEYAQMLRLPVVFSDAEMILGSTEHEMKNQSKGSGRGDYFFKAASDVVVTPTVKVSITITKKYVKDGFTDPHATPTLYFGVKNENNPNSTNSYLVGFIPETSRKVNDEYIFVPTTAGNIKVKAIKITYSLDITFEDTIPMELTKDDKLTFYVSDLSEPVIYNLTVEAGGFIKIRYKGKSNNSKNIPVIDPEKLIQTYLDKMSGTPNTFKAQIEWGEKDYKTKIIAAESVRGLPNAYVYGSPNDFFDWMQVLGYEYSCTDRELTFKPRGHFFKKGLNDPPAMYLKARELADLIVQADQTYAYTSVEIGYDKQNYDSINGRCEANGTFCYTTGYTTREDNKLSLISPYRGDSLGIEFLCQEVDKDNKEAKKETTDIKSDNDVFFAALTEKSDGSGYTEYMGIKIVDKELGLEMFNAPFNPYYLISYNDSLIGVNTKRIKFKSTNMSRTAKIVNKNGQEISIYSNRQITKKLFDPIEYNFAAGHWQKIPSEELRDGLIYFEWEGKVLKGFIKRIRKNYAAETETTWILWAVI